MNDQPAKPKFLLRWYPRIVNGLQWMALFIVYAWCIGAAACVEHRVPAWVKIGLAIAVAIGIPGWIVHSRRREKSWLVALLPLGIVWISLACFYATITPSHDRDWQLAQQILPTAEFDGDFVTIHGIRSFRYGPVNPSRLTYDDRYDLNQLKSVWLGVDRFTDFKPMAHTFLSFGFDDGTHRTNYLSFSIETRREADENSYSPIRGIYKNYEMIYVLADEQDVLSVRSDVRQHVVQLYPIKATQGQTRLLFTDMLRRVNEIHDQPEWYHTLMNNCTNNIVVHTNTLLDNPISSWQRDVVFPGYSDWLAMKLGMVDTDLTLEEAREHFRIDQRVKAFDGTGEFSEFIREGLIPPEGP